MARTHKYRPKDILAQYDFNTMKGKRSNNREALRRFYAANYAKLKPGLEEARERLGMSSHASLKSVLYKLLDSRVDGTIDTATSGELSEALKSTIVKDVSRSEIKKRGYMLSWSTAVGGPNWQGRPRKRYSDLWEQWIADSDWTGDVDDYKRLEHAGGGKYIFTSKAGEKFELSFTVSKSMVATYRKLKS